MEANYFTILWWFLPYINMNQPWAYMCPPSWAPFHPIPLGCPRAAALSALLHASNLHWSSIFRMLIYMLIYMFWFLQNNTQIGMFLSHHNNTHLEQVLKFFNVEFKHGSTVLFSDGLSFSTGIYLLSNRLYYCVILKQWLLHLNSLNWTDLKE